MLWMDTFHWDAVVSAAAAPDPHPSNGGLRFGWPTIVSSCWKGLPPDGFSSPWSPGTSGGPSTASNWRPGATGWAAEKDREWNVKEAEDNHSLKSEGLMEEGRQEQGEARCCRRAGRMTNTNKYQPQAPSPHEGDSSKFSIFCRRCCCFVFSPLLNFTCKHRGRRFAVAILRLRSGQVHRSAAISLTISLAST